MKRFAAVLVLILLSAAAAFAQKSIKIYFSNEKLDPNMQDCSKVFPVERKIPNTQAVAKAALEELLKGPTADEKSKGYFSWFSEQTKDALISVKITKGAAYVNLKDISEIISSASSSCGSSIFISQVETTLKQFPTIRKVFFAFEGNPRNFYEWMQGECPEELKNCDGREFK